MTYKLDVYCGLYCGACFVMIAYKQHRSDCIPSDCVSCFQDKEFKCHGCKSDILLMNLK